MADNNYDNNAEVSKKEMKELEKAQKEAEKAAKKAAKKAEKGSGDKDGKKAEKEAEKAAKKAEKKAEKAAKEAEEATAEGSEAQEERRKKQIPKAPKGKKITIDPINGAPLTRSDVDGKILTDKAYETVRKAIAAGKITDNSEIIDAFIRTSFVKPECYDPKTLHEFMRLYEPGDRVAIDCLSRSFDKSKSPEAFSDYIGARFGYASENEEMQNAFNLLEKKIVDNCDRDYINSIKNMPGSKKLFDAIEEEWLHGGSSHLAKSGCAPSDGHGTPKEWLFSLGASILIRDIDAATNGTDEVGSLKEYNKTVVPDMMRWEEKYSGCPAFGVVADKFRETYSDAAGYLTRNPPRFEEFAPVAEELQYGSDYLGLGEKEKADEAVCSMLSKDLSFCSSVGDFNEHYGRITNDAGFKALATAGTVFAATKGAAARKLDEQKNMDDVMTWYNGFGSDISADPSVRKAVEKAYGNIAASSSDVSSLVAATVAAGAFAASGEDVLCATLAKMVAACAGLPEAIACAETAKDTPAFMSQPVIDALAQQYADAIEASASDAELLKAYADAKYGHIRDIHKETFCDRYGVIIRGYDKLPEARACFDRCADTYACGSEQVISALTGRYLEAVRMAATEDDLIQALKDVMDDSIIKAEAPAFGRKFSDIMPSDVTVLAGYIDEVEQLSVITCGYCIGGCIEKTESNSRSDLEFFESLIPRMDCGIPGYEDICSVLYGKLAECLEPVYGADGTVGSFDDAVKYLEYCGKWKDHDFVKVQCAIGTLFVIADLDSPGVFEKGRSAYFAGPYAEDFDDTDNGPLSYGIDIMEDREGRERFYKEVCGFEPEDDVSRCYFAQIIRYIDWEFIPYQLATAGGIITDLVKASERAHYYAENIENASAFMGALHGGPVQLTSTPSEAAAFLAGFAEWRRDTTRPIVHLPNDLISKYGDVSITYKMLRFADAYLYAFEGKPGQAFDAIETYSNICDNLDYEADELSVWLPLATETLLMEYEMNIYAREYSSAEVVAKRFEIIDADASTIMKAYANFLSVNGKRAAVMQVQSPFDSSIIKMTRHISKTDASGNLLAAAYYVSGMMNFSRNDWEPTRERASSAEAGLIKRTDRDSILMARIHMLQAEIANKGGKTLEFESRLNKAIRILNDLPRSAIVIQLLNECDKRLEGDHAPAAQHTAQAAVAETRFFPPGIDNPHLQVTIPHIAVGGGHKVFKAVDTRSNAVVALRVPVIIDDITARVPPDRQQRTSRPLRGGDDDLGRGLAGGPRKRRDASRIQQQTVPLERLRIRGQRCGQEPRHHEQEGEARDDRLPPHRSRHDARNGIHPQRHQAHQHVPRERFVAARRLRFRIRGRISQEVQHHRRIRLPRTPRVQGRHRGHRRRAHHQVGHMVRRSHALLHPEQQDASVRKGFRLHREADAGCVRTQFVQQGVRSRVREDIQGRPRGEAQRCRAQADHQGPLTNTNETIQDNTTKIQKVKRK